MRLLDISWEDVLLTQVLGRLALEDLLSLRRASRECELLVDLYLSRLRALTITNRARYSGRGFAVYTAACRRLRSVNLARSGFVTDELLVPLLRNNPGLERLELGHCGNVSAACLQPAILRCEGLRVLRLGGCAWLTTGALQALALHRRLLEEVDLSYCGGVSCAGLRLFLKRFCRLRTVVLQGLDAVDDECLLVLSKYHRSLRHLNVAHCVNVTDVGVGAVGSSCLELECLAVRRCPMVTEKSLGPLRPRVSVDVRCADPSRTSSRSVILL